MPLSRLRHFQPRSPLLIVQSVCLALSLPLSLSSGSLTPASLLPTMSACLYSPSSSGRSLLSLLVLFVAVLCLSRGGLVSAQPYVPQEYQLSSCSSSGATVTTLGDVSVPDPTAYGVTAGIGGGTIYFTAFNNTAFGAALTQMSLALGINTGLTSPAHLTMGVYSLATASGNVMTLVGQTDEITLYPSGPQTLYANLLQPVRLLSGGQYATGCVVRPLRDCVHLI